MPNNTLTLIKDPLHWLPGNGTPTTFTKLVNLYRKPGPFSSVYLSTATSSFQQQPGDFLERWQPLRRRLKDQGSSDNAIQVIERHLSADGPARAQGIAVLASQDGASVTDYDLLPPVTEMAALDPLPFAGQLLEWQQRRVPALVVHVDDQRAQVSSFAVDQLGRQYSIVDDPSATTTKLAKLATAVGVELVIIAGDNEVAQGVAEALPLRVPLACRVVREPDAESPDDLAAATMRQVCVSAGATTLRHLREQRFLATHGSAVEGVGATADALNRGVVELLLVHNSPNDTRTLWTGSLPRQIHTSPDGPGCSENRLVDALIKSAVQQSVPIRMIPATGPAGPADEVAALLMTSVAS